MHLNGICAHCCSITLRDSNSREPRRPEANREFLRVARRMETKTEEAARSTSFQVPLKVLTLSVLAQPRNVVGCCMEDLLSLEHAQYAADMLRIFPSLSLVPLGCRGLPRPPRRLQRQWLIRSSPHTQASPRQRLTCRFSRYERRKIPMARPGGLVGWTQVLVLVPRISENAFAGKSCWRSLLRFF